MEYIPNFNYYFTIPKRCVGTKALYMYVIENRVNLVIINYVYVNIRYKCTSIIKISFLV